MGRGGGVKRGLWVVVACSLLCVCVARVSSRRTIRSRFAPSSLPLACACLRLRIFPSFGFSVVRVWLYFSEVALGFHAKGFAFLILMQLTETR